MPTVPIPTVIVGDTDTLRKRCDDVWDLSWTNLSRANLYGTDLSGANLAGADHDDFTVWPSGFDKGRLA